MNVQLFIRQHFYKQRPRRHRPALSRTVFRLRHCCTAYGRWQRQLAIRRSPRQLHLIKWVLPMMIHHRIMMLAQLLPAHHGHTHSQRRRPRVAADDQADLTRQTDRSS